MFEKLKEKQLNKFLDMIYDYLYTTDYTDLKSMAIQMKWDMLKDNDDAGYRMAEMFSNIVDELEACFTEIKAKQEEGDK